MALDINALKKHFDTQTKGSDSFIPNEGETQIRILPPWNRMGNLPYKKMGYHDINGERLLCPKEIEGGACPICDNVRGLYKSKKEEDQSLAKELRAVQRFYFNIVVRGQESKGVQKFGCGKKLAEKIVNIITTELKRDITDPNTGHDLVIVKKMIGDFPDYSSSYVIFEASPLGNAELLDKMYDLDREFQPKSYDELREAIERRLGPTVAASSAYIPQSLQAPVQPAPVQQAPVAPAPVQPAPVQQAPVAPAPVVEQPVPQAQPAPADAASMSADDILNMLNP